MTSMLPGSTRPRRRRIRLAALLLVPALIAAGVLVQKAAGAAAGSRTLRMEIDGTAFLKHPGLPCVVSVNAATDTQLSPDTGETGGNAQANATCFDPSRETYLGFYASVTDDNQIVNAGVQGNIHSSEPCEFHTFEGDCEEYAHIRNATITPFGELPQPAGPYRTTFTSGEWRTFTLTYDGDPDDFFTFRLRATIVTG